MGYHRAGFEVTGVDIVARPRYPFTFIQADALEYLEQHGHEYDVIHASPPCQAYSITKSLHGNDHPELVEPVRAKLKQLGKPYIIENVPGAPLKHPIVLRGNMFGLRVIRDRLFEISPFFFLSPEVQQVSGTTNSHRGMSTGGEYITVAGHNFLVKEAGEAMGIDWMSQKGLSQAIPPAYTEWIGAQMKQHLVT